MGKNEAKAKVRKELSAYREATKKLDGGSCYMKAPEIMFTEAAAARLQFLCDDEENAAMVEAGGTLEGCVKSIIAYCRQDIGNSGEVSEDQFRAAIRDYYRTPNNAMASKTEAAVAARAAQRSPVHDLSEVKPIGEVTPKKPIRVPRIKVAAVAAPDPEPEPPVDEVAAARLRRWEEKQARIRANGPTILDTQIGLFDFNAAAPEVDDADRG